MSELLFIGIDSEIQGEGGSVEGREIYMTSYVNKIYLLFTYIFTIS